MGCDLENYRQGLSTLAEGIGLLYEQNAAGQMTKEISKLFRYQFMMGLPDSYQVALADLSEETPLGVIIKRTEKLRYERELRHSIKEDSPQQMSATLDKADEKAQLRIFHMLPARTYQRGSYYFRIYHSGFGSSSSGGLSVSQPQEPSYTACSSTTLPTATMVISSN